MADEWIARYIRAFPEFRAAVPSSRGSRVRGFVCFRARGGWTSIEDTYSLSRRASKGPHLRGKPPGPPPPQRGTSLPGRRELCVPPDELEPGRANPAERRNPDRRKPAGTRP